MIRRLFAYLPPVLQTVTEMAAIMDDGAQYGVSDLWDAADSVFDEQFLFTASFYAVKRWEQIIGLKPVSDDTLEDRKLTIRSRLSESAPYTMNTLRKLLNALIGADNYELTLFHAQYKLRVVVSLGRLQLIATVNELLRRVVPANITLEVSARYNTWHQIKLIKWGDTESMTWRQMREDEL